MEKENDFLVTFFYNMPLGFYSTLFFKLGLMQNQLLEKKKKKDPLIKTHDTRIIFKLINPQI